MAEAGFPVGVEEASLGYENGLGVKDRGLEKITQGSVIIRVGLDREAMNGEL